MQTHTHTYTGGTLVYLCDPRKHLFYLNKPKKIKRANRKKFARLLRAGVAVAVAATAGVAVQPNPHAASDKTTTKIESVCEKSKIVIESKAYGT